MELVIYLKSGGSISYCWADENEGLEQIEYLNSEWGKNAKLISLISDHKHVIIPTDNIAAVEY